MPAALFGEGEASTRSPRSRTKEFRTGELPATLAGHAEEQSGLVTRTQCLAEGLTVPAIEWRLKTNRWSAAHRAVYQTEPGRSGWEVDAVAALLAPGKGAALCRSSAAFLHGLRKSPGPTIEVVIPFGRHIAQPAGLTVVRCRDLDDRCDEREYPWRTTIEDTILDLGDLGTLDDVVGLITQACQKSRTSPTLIRQKLKRRSRHRWRTLLLEVLDDVGDGAESAAEIRYIRDVERSHGLPAGERQMPTGDGSGRRHDTGYPAYLLIVEVDGRVAHEGWAARRRDTGRDRGRAKDGWLTTRVYWAELAGDPCSLAVEVADLLQGRGWQGQAVPCRRLGCAVSRQRGAETSPGHG